MQNMTVTLKSNRPIGRLYLTTPPTHFHQCKACAWVELRVSHAECVRLESPDPCGCMRKKDRVLALVRC